MASATAGIALHLHSGIPVIELEGEWNDAKEGQLTETVQRLVSAGHFEVIVNVSRASALPRGDRNWVERLEALAAVFRAHCGHLDIVGTVEQAESFLKKQARTLLRWATSEEQAICRITGVPVMTSGRKVNARLLQ